MDACEAGNMDRKEAQSRKVQEEVEVARQGFVALAYTRLANENKHGRCMTGQPYEDTRIRKSFRTAVVLDDPEEIDKVYEDAVKINDLWKK